MPPGDEGSHLTLLSLVKGELGGIREDVRDGMKDLKGEIGHVKAKVDELQEQSVKKGDCRGIQREIQQQIERKSREMAPLSAQATLSPLTEAITQLNAKLSQPVVVQQKPWLQRLRESAAAITAVVSFVGMLGYGIWHLSHAVVTIEQTVRNSQQQQRQQISQQLNKGLNEIKASEPKVIYVYPDSGSERRIVHRPPRRPRRTP